MKVYISVDIEGVNSILEWAEADRNNSRYQELQKQMTQEVIVACETAHKMGANEIIVRDAHGSAANLNMIDLPPYVKLIRGWSRHPYMMMQEIDESYDAAILIGYHSPSRSGGNPLSHTMTTDIHHMKINGEIMSEFMLNTMTAASVGVPVVFVSGDHKLCKDVKRVNSNIETVETNEGIGKSIICKHHHVILDELGIGIEKALKKSMNNCLIDLPNEFKVEICYKNHYDAYRAYFYGDAKLINDDTIEFITNDYFEVLKLMMFVM